ncbi:MAG TPA: hypothetical protein VFG87_28060 [Amycolatopsis sp.]|nr:hypothetical protein [Amycolatopsis sp.]
MTVGFLTAQLGGNAKILVEAAWGANLALDASNWIWTDITTDVRQADGQRVVISPMAHSDWLEQTQPAECTFELDNTSGAYSKGPASSNYPNVRRSTPIRISITLNNVTYFTRFFGYAYSWKPWWDTSGNLAVVTVKAAGKLRQLQQGSKKPITNVLTRYHTRNGAAAVWPFDDGLLSTQAANAVAGGSPMRVGSASMAFGIDVSSTFPAAGAVAGLPVPGPNADVAAATINAPLSGLLHVDMWRNQAAEPDASETQLLVVDLRDPTGFWGVEIRARMSQISPPVTAAYLVLVPGAGQVLDSSVGSAVNPFDNAFHNVHVTFQQSGGNVNATLYVDGAIANTHTFTTATLPSLLTTVHLRNAIVAGLGIGNQDEQSVIAINTTAAGAPSFSVSARYAGELVTDRLTRLFAEEGGNGLPLVVVGTTTTTMGPQGADTFLNLVDECVNADLGTLYDGLTQAFTFVTRSARYNQAAALTLDASAGQLDDPFAPDDDDQFNRNLATVKRKDGSSAVAVDSTGPLGTAAIGTFESTPGSDLNLAADQSLFDIASWLVHVGTVDEPYRYPTLGIDLAAAPTLASAWLNTAPSERIDVTNISSEATQHPPGTISLVLEGYSEELSPFDWVVQANCSPYRPWEVFQIADSRLGRIETDGSSLPSSYSPSATSLTVASSVAPWDTSAPSFDVDIAGEQVTVTAIASVLTDAFGRTVGSGSWGSADTGQSYTLSVSAAGSVGSGVGVIQPNSTGSDFQAYADIGSSDFDLVCNVSVAALPASGTWGIGVVGRLTNGSNFYSLRMTSTSAGVMSLLVSKRVAGSGSTVATASLSTTYVGGTTYRIRFQGIGQALRGKIWLPAGTEPGWNIDTTDSSLTTGTNAGAFARNDTAVTTHVMSYDNFTVTNPQTFTVTRSVNGVSKAQSAGAAVKLWKPGVIAL